MWPLLQAVNRNLILAIPAAMIMGFGFGMAWDPVLLRSLIVPFTFLMVYPMMVTLRVREVFAGGDVRAQLLAQVINFAIIPFLAYGAGMLFLRDQPSMILGLLLAGLVPTSGMTISWTGIAKGNLAAAVKMTVVGLALGSLATPFYVRWLLGAAVDVNMVAVMKQIGVIVFLPMAAGYLTQRALVRRFGPKAFQTRWVPRFPALSTLGVVGIVFIAIALQARAIASAPGLVPAILAPLGIVYAANYLLSSIVGKALLPRGDAIALVYGSVMRNLSIALAVAINAFGPHGSSAALVIAIAYVVQVQSAAWYVRFTDRIFGAAPASPTPAGAAAEQKPAAAAPSEDLVPRFRKILYATDLSETARYAARYACSLGHRYDAPVTVLHVVPDTLDAYSAEAGLDLAGPVPPDRRVDLNRENVEAAKTALEARVRQVSSQVAQQIPRCPVSTSNILVKIGHPAQQIVATVREGGYDLVVMGTHGHGRLEDTFVGSVAGEVIRLCRTPVLVVRIPNDTPSRV